LQRRKFYEPDGPTNSIKLLKDKSWLVDHNKGSHPRQAQLNSSEQNTFI